MDPRTTEKQPPFEGEKEQPHPGLEQKMMTKPDHGEDSYVGHARLNGKKALVTGGDSGIGRAVCLAYAREGADVAFSYVPSEEEDAKETRRLIEGAGKKCVAVPVDFSSQGKAECQRLVDTVVREFGCIDILVNNAAFQGKAVSDEEGKTIENLSWDRVYKTIQVNILPFFEVTRCALPSMSPGSSIINTASIQAYKPTSAILDYACTKGAIVTFTKSLGMDLPLSRGIRANCVAPGPVWTPFIPQSFDEKSTQEFGKSSAPIGRPAQPKELAPPYVFLASADASYISGNIFAVTGGIPAGA